MKFINAQRVLTAAGVVVAAVAVPVAMATPAAAGPVACMQYLTDQGIYTVGDRARAACRNPALTIGWSKQANPYCYTGLVQLGVRTGHATEACLRA
ncbi:hypothetical protein AB0957_02615 [Streptomyces zhihengii]|uniref:hypothetical protein n=1 Tax=Streptomyces zhihengii TaxID=1818004 RepID=UPI003451DEEC